MVVRDLLKYDLKLINEPSNWDREIKDFYTGDLLSWVMGHVRGEDVCLLTVLNSINVIAVATLVDLSCIIFCEGVEPSIDIINKANDEGVMLFVSSDTTFHTGLRLAK